MCNTGLVALTPVAIMLSPSSLNTPIDYILGIAFPFHAHVGLNYVISDYVPKANRILARAGLLGLTVITVAGLFKLNFDGPGVTESLKSLWRSRDSK